MIFWMSFIAAFFAVFYLVSETSWRLFLLLFVAIDYFLNDYRY